MFQARAEAEQNLVGFKIKGQINGKEARERPLSSWLKRPLNTGGKPQQLPVATPP